MQMRKGLARSASQKSRDETRLAKQHLLKEFTHFQPEQAEDSRFLVAGLHALSAALTVTALFASGRQSIHLAEIDGVYVGAIWSHGCSRQKEDCFPSDQANRIFLIGAHAVGSLAYLVSFGMVVVIRDTLASSKLFKTMAVISLLAAIAQVASVLLLLGAVGFDKVKAGVALELAPILEICLNLTILVGSLTSRQRKLTNDGLRTNKSAEADLRQVHKLELYGLGDKDVIDKLRSAEAKDNGNPAFKRSLSTLLRRPRERDPPPLPRYQPLPERPAEGHSQRVPKSVQPSSHAFRRSNSTPAVIGPPRYQATPDLVRSNSEPEPRVPESKLEVPPLQPESHSDDSELGLLYRPAIELHMPTPERASRPRYSTLYRQISDMPQQSNLNPTDPSGMIQNMLKEVRGMPPTPLQHGGVSRPVSQFIPLRPPRPPTVDFSAMADELPSSPLRPVALRDSRMLQTETNASRGSDSSSGFDTLLSHYRASRSLDDTRRRISSVVARTPAQSLPQFRVTSPINQSDDPVSHPLSENNITTEASEVLACPVDDLVETRPSDAAQQGHSEENKKVDTSSVDQSTDSPPLSSDPIFLDAMVSPEEATHDIQKHSSAQRVLPPSSMMHFESIGSAFSKEAAPKRQEVVDDLDQNDTGSAQKQVASSQSGQLLDLNAVNAKLERQSETQQNQRDDTDLLLTKLSLIEPSDMPGSQGSTLDAEGLAARLAIIAQVQRQSDDASSERKVGQSS